MSLILEGKVRNEYLITGGVVSLIVSAVCVYLLKRVARLAEDIERLQNEIISRRQAEEALRRSEGLLHSVVESSADAIFVKDITGRYLLMNTAGSVLVGRKAEEILGKDDTALFPPEEAARIMAHDRHLIDSASTFMYEHTLTMAAGPRLVQVRKGPVLDRTNRVIGVYGISRDITERRDAEIRLRESENKFRSIFDQASDGIMIADPERKHIIEANNAICALLGYTREELVRLGIADLHPKEELPRILELFKRQSRGEISLVPDVPLLRKDGSVIHAEVNSVLRTLDGKPCLIGVFRDMSEQKKMLESLRMREKQLSESQRIAHVGSWEHNLTTGQVFWSDELFRLLGLDPKKDPGDFNMFFDMIHPADQPLLKKAIDHSLRTGEPFDMDYRLTRKDGTMRILHAQAELISDDTGTQMILSGTAQDITERKKGEERLLQIMAAVESTSDAIGISDVQGRHIYQNKALSELFGYQSAEELQAAGGGQAVVKDPSIAREIFVHIQNGKPWTGELEMVTKNGRVFPAFERADAIKDASGNIIGLIGIITDITERKQAEETLRASEERFALAMRGANDGLWDWDLSTDEVYYSPRWKSMLGYAADELGNNLDTWKRLVHPDDRERTLDVVRSVMEGRSAKFEVEFRMQHKDGSFREILSRAFLADDSAGIRKRLVGTHVDITGRKRAEEKIRQSEQFIRNILNNVDEGFIVLDRDFRILTANKAYCDQAGGVCDEIVGRHCYEISHRTNRPCGEAGEDCAVRHVFDTGKPHVAVHRHTDSKGGILYVETKAFPITDSAGTVTSAIETVTNITEKHLLEEERLKTQKLEAIGTLAGGIAHDFNNLLQGVFGYISMAKRTHDRKEQSLAMLEQAEQALHLSVNLTTQLLTFSKGGKPVKKKMKLQAVIENSVKFALSGSRVDYRINQGDNLWPVDADEGQITQVIQNIVLNADQAMPMGGTVSVIMKNVNVPVKDIPLSPRAGRYVEIRIEDTGIGIPDQYLSKIFDPYFTTKDRGSGLGLATSYSIIKNHGGLIDVKSRPGSGTTFIIYIPATVEEETKSGTHPLMAAGTRTGRILVMDDEEVVRNIVGIMITSLGHEVEFAENGEEAVAKYRMALSGGKRFGIVILDLTIRGGKGGKETFQELIKLDPEVTAVVSSGYSDDAAISDFQSHGFKAYLAKPYHIDTLKNTLNVLLK